MKKSGQIYEIIRADIEEISLVGRGANMRSFFLIKSLTGGRQMKAFAKAYLNLFGTEATETFLKTMESLDDELRKERTEALETLVEIKDDFDEEVSKALAVLITNIPVIKEVVEKEKAVLSDEVKKAIEDLNKAAGIEQSEPASKSNDEAVEKKVEPELVEVDLDELEKAADDKAKELVDKAKAKLTV